MNADRLLAHFERISDAPDAIYRLRRFILDLAVRGKLVEQDPGEEPADVLLDRIASKKAKVSSRSRTRAKTDTETDPYPLPPSWVWTRIADLGLLSPRNDADNSVMCSFVPMSLISAAFGVEAAHEKRPWGEIKKGYTHISDGDVAVAKITPCFENGKSTVFRNLTGGIGAGTTELHVVRPIETSPDYIVLLLKSPFFIENGIPLMTGTAGQKRLPGDYFAYRPFPLPPLAEQHRIVAKVDELMLLCDRLEASQAEREGRRDRLVMASFNRLSQPTDPGEFKKDAQFQLSNLNRLPTKPEHIKELRKAILNLAVRGKLVAQDDEWQVKRFSELCPFITSGSRGWAAFYAKSGAAFVRAQNIRFGTLRLEELAHVTPPATTETQRCRLRLGDLLIVITGAGVTTPALVDRDLGEAYVSQHVALARPLDTDWSLWLLLCLMATEGCRGPLVERAYGSGKPGLNLDNIRTLDVPLPPLAEQKRIVAKVDELMIICDQLENQLEYQQKGRRRLLEALLYEALEGVG